MPRKKFTRKDTVRERQRVRSMIRQDNGDGTSTYFRPAEIETVRTDEPAPHASVLRDKLKARRMAEAQH